MNVSLSRTHDVSAIASQTVRVLTYNLGLLALPPFGLFALASGIRARLAAAPAQLRATGADIIALQEVFSPRHSKFLCNALHGTYPYAYVPRHDRCLLGSGLMFLSRYRITQGLFLPCKVPGRFASAAEKGCLCVEVDGPGDAPLHFVNLHLVADSGSRQSEIAHALAVARANAAILLGDFNCSPEIRGADYQRILAAGYSDAFVAAGQGGVNGSNVTWDIANPLNRVSRYRDEISQRIDHVFIPRTLRGTLDPMAAEIVLQEAILETASGPVPLSDHYGMLAAFVCNKK